MRGSAQSPEKMGPKKLEDSSLDLSEETENRNPRGRARTTRRRTKRQEGPKRGKVGDDPRLLVKRSANLFPFQMSKSDNDFNGFHSSEIRWPNFIQQSTNLAG